MLLRKVTSAWKVSFLPETFAKANGLHQWKFTWSQLCIIFLHLHPFLFFASAHWRAVAQINPQRPSTCNGPHIAQGSRVHLFHLLLRGPNIQRAVVSRYLQLLLLNSAAFQWEVSCGLFMSSQDGSVQKTWEMGSLISTVIKTIKKKITATYWRLGQVLYIVGCFHG